MRAGAEGAKHEGELPEIFDLETIKIERAVVERGILLYDVTSPVETPVADRDLIGADGPRLALLADPRPEPLGSQDDPQRGDGIAEAAEPFLDRRVELLRKFTADPDTRDIEEGMAIDRADIDPSAVTLDNDVGRRREVERAGKGARQVIRGSGGNDSQRQAALDHSRRSG